jgi:predicted secreted protein
MGKVIVPKLKLGAVPTEKAITDVKFTEQADEIDVTDSMSAGDSKEFISGLISRSIAFGAWFRDDETPLVFNDTSAFQLILGAKKYSGELIVTGAELAAQMTDAAKYAYTARITGAVTFGTAS